MKAAKTGCTNPVKAERIDRFRTIRAAYGVRQAEFGAMLGFAGDPQTVARKVRRYELGEAEIDGPLWKLLGFLEMAVERRAP